MMVISWENLLGREWGCGFGGCGVWGDVVCCGVGLRLLLLDVWCFSWLGVVIGVN